MHVVRIDAHGNVTWNVHQYDGIYVAVCDALNLTAMGETFAELTESIMDMIEHLFRDLFKRGEMEHYLLARGWRQLGPQPMSVAPDVVQFDLPMDIVMASGHEARC